MDTTQSFMDNYVPLPIKSGTDIKDLEIIRLKRSNQRLKDNAKKIKNIILDALNAEEEEGELTLSGEPEISHDSDQENRRKKISKDALSGAASGSNPDQLQEETPASVSELEETQGRSKRRKMCTSNEEENVTSPTAPNEERHSYLYLNYPNLQIEGGGDTFEGYGDMHVEGQELSCTLVEFGCRFGCLYRCLYSDNMFCFPLPTIDVLDTEGSSLDYSFPREIWYCKDPSEFIGGLQCYYCKTELYLLKRGEDATKYWVRNMQPTE